MNEHEASTASQIETDPYDQWAFGTSFDDPLAGVDTTLAAGIDGADLAAYCLMLGDDALIAAQRLAEWCAKAPELEEEMALANIGLDLLGQARLLLARAAAADPSVIPVLPAASPVPPEDALAFFRDEPQFRCIRLVELPNGDFAQTIVRLFIFSVYRFALLQSLKSSRDPVLAAVAAKGANEVAYHRDYAARWVLTLAEGTAESRRRTVAALNAQWPYVHEIFQSLGVEQRLSAQHAAVESATLQDQVEAAIADVLAAGGLAVPVVEPAILISGRGGRDGVHTEHLGYLLAEMQSVARAHPCGRW